MVLEDALRRCVAERRSLARKGRPGSNANTNSNTATPPPRGATLAGLAIAVYPAGTGPADRTLAGWIAEDELRYYTDLFTRITRNQTELLIPTRPGPFETLILEMLAELLQGPRGRELVRLLAEYGSEEVKRLTLLDDDGGEKQFDDETWAHADDETYVDPGDKIRFSRSIPMYSNRMVTFPSNVRPREIVRIIETESGGQAARQAFTEFAHELIHALHDKLNRWGKGTRGERSSEAEERQTVSGSAKGIVSEGDILAEHGLPRRGDYYDTRTESVTDAQRRAIDKQIAKGTVTVDALLEKVVAKPSLRLDLLPRSHPDHVGSDLSKASLRYLLLEAERRRLIAAQLAQGVNDAEAISRATGIPVRDVEWLTVVIRRL
ncbi:MAG: Effector protein [Miltoncostaeaceae bacterium]|jgi:hypothetical protein|nr:Effector protein [Miltoncostaeaceae bacterium]